MKRKKYVGPLLQIPAWEKVTADHARIAIVQENGILLARYLRETAVPDRSIIDYLVRLLDPKFLDPDDCENRRQLKFGSVDNEQALVFGRTNIGNGTVGRRKELRSRAMCSALSNLKKAAINKGEKPSKKKIEGEVADQFSVDARTVRAAWAEFGQDFSAG